MPANVISEVFYEDVEVGIGFVDGIGMEILHRDDDLVVVARDMSKVYLVEDAELAAKDRPELRIETDGIDSIHDRITSRRVTAGRFGCRRSGLREWGAPDPAAVDSPTVCVVLRSWT